MVFMERYRATSDMPSIEFGIFQIVSRVGKPSDAEKASENKAEGGVCCNRTEPVTAWCLGGTLGRRGWVVLTPCVVIMRTACDRLTVYGRSTEICSLTCTRARVSLFSFLSSSYNVSYLEMTI